VYNWLKDVTPTAYSFLHWGVGDFNGDSVDDVWGMQTTTIIVGPPQLTEQHQQIWVGYGSGRGGGLAAPAVYMLPETTMQLSIDTRGSKSGRFDSSADLMDDIVLEVTLNGQGPSQLRVITSNGWTQNLTAVSGRSGGEQFAMVGDMDNDGSDDLIWIGTTPNHPINLFVRSAIKTIPSLNTGEQMSGGGVASYIWTSSPRLRRRKP